MAIGMDIAQEGMRLLSVNKDSMRMMGTNVLDQQKAAQLRQSEGMLGNC